MYASVCVCYRFGFVAADGRYSSPVASKQSRFNAMLAALTPTRLCLTVQAMAAMKVRETLTLNTRVHDELTFTTNVIHLVLDDNISENGKLSDHHKRET